MELTDHSLRQMDEDDIRKLPEEAVRELAVRLLKDLKEAHGNYSDPLTPYTLSRRERELQNHWPHAAFFH
jgi:hypothetical protein